MYCAYHSRARGPYPSSNTMSTTCEVVEQQGVEGNGVGCGGGDDGALATKRKSQNTTSAWLSSLQILPMKSKTCTSTDGWRV